MINQISGPDGKFILNYLAQHNGHATQLELKQYIDASWDEYFDCRDALLDEGKITISSHGGRGKIYLVKDLDTLLDKAISDIDLQETFQRWEEYDDY